MARAYAVVLAMLLFPGALEAVADVLHDIAAGHSVDADFANNHHRKAPTHEHHCSGAFHACGCCAVVHVVAVNAFVGVGAPRLDSVDLQARGLWRDLRVDGVDALAPFFRPPIV